MPDYRLLLLKYVAHVAAAEGDDFAFSTNISPCDMLNLSFTEEEKEELKKVFQACLKWSDALTPDQRNPLSIDRLFDE